MPAPTAIPYLVLNAFSRLPLGGNPAAVVLLDSTDNSANNSTKTAPWPEDTALLGIAAQFNLSQTAFLRSNGRDTWKIRWFSPTREVPLCGHASLAACSALRHWGKWSGQAPLTLHTEKRGNLRCISDDDKIVMGFPSYDTQPTPLPERVAKGLGLSQSPVGAHTSGPLLLLEMESARLVEQAKPNPRVLTHWHRHGVALTARDQGECDFVTRMFAPRFGIDEDPACGSAHCVLGPYWAARLGKPQLLARQASERGGQIGVHCLPGPDGAQVELSGHALVALAGQLELSLASLLKL